MDIAKVIRVIGYIVWNIIWAPVILLYITITPIVAIGLTVRDGRSIKKCLRQIKRTWTDSNARGAKFIKNGEW